MSGRDCQERQTAKGQSSEILVTQVRECSLPLHTPPSLSSLSLPFPPLPSPPLLSPSSSPSTAEGALYPHPGLPLPGGARFPLEAGGDGCLTLPQGGESSGAAVLSGRGNGGHISWSTLLLAARDIDTSLNTRQEVCPGFQLGRAF